MTETPDIDVETCLQQLADPAVLLADALHRVHRADAVQGTIDALAESQAEAERLVARQDYLMRSADALAFIARTAAELADRGQATMTEIDALLDDPKPLQPQAVNGVRFTANIIGHWVGRVAGREWVFVAGVGYIDVTEADEMGDRGFRLSGRVASVTPDHVLCITDGGTSVVLPRALITESPDE